MMADLRARVREALWNAATGGYHSFVSGDTDAVTCDLLDCSSLVEGEAYELVRPIVAEWQADARKDWDAVKAGGGS